MGAAVRERRPQLVNDVSADPRYVRPPAGVEVKAELAVPILHVDQPLGVLNVESHESFAPEDTASLQIVADHLAVAIRNARLFQSAQALAALEERQRLARDLHDSVAQILFSVTLLAQSLGAAWRRDPQEGEREVQRLLDLTRTALAEMRALLAELRPAEPVPELAHAESTLSSLSRIRREGLAQSLRAHLAEAVPAGTRWELRAVRYRPQPLEIEEVLYRIAAEAVHNAVKHARAARLDLSLSVLAGRARLRVRDDGRGFDPQQAARRRHGDLRGGGLGLLSMRERAESIGGRLRLTTRAARGTTIDVVLPVPAGAPRSAAPRPPAGRKRA
jgi:signal transduction histidine kinase